MEKREYMALAVFLAKKGIGHTRPNPLVGAVIVKGNRIIGTGYHEKYGGLHAERNAILNCTESPKGAVMYVTLTPCCHCGKTPPCTDAIIESGISKVVIGSEDPNPLVSGKSIQLLEEAGITVVANFERVLCDSLNGIFFHYIKEKTPFVTLKYAMTLDGKIATSSGLSKWITGELARQKVHQDRDRYAAVMVGINTVLKDDPFLTCRIENGKNPIRIVCDSSLRIPHDCNLIKTINEAPLYIATCSQDAKKIMELEHKGVKILCTNPLNGRVDLKELMRILGNLDVDSVLTEGGGILNWAMLEMGIVNNIMAYISPKIFGGNGRTPVAGSGVNNPSESIVLKNRKITVLGEDILVEGQVMQKCSQE